MPNVDDAESALEVDFIKLILSFFVDVCVGRVNGILPHASSAVSHIGGCRRIAHLLCVLCSPSMPPDRFAGLGSDRSTYSLVQVDGVLARHHVGDGRTGLLAGLDVGHFCEPLVS